METRPSIVLAELAQRRLEEFADPERALLSQKFFKTGPGQYAEGDLFLGVTVPQIRKVAKSCVALPLRETWELLAARTHEVRLLALIVLVDRFRSASSGERKEIFQGYLARTTQVNNWDLVDVSAPTIVGPYLGKGQAVWIKQLLHSRNLWERRIVMIASLHSIRLGELSTALRFARELQGDNHDLIHKAVGWMLREVGKRDVSALEGFLLKPVRAIPPLPSYRYMPRTMLRYAIEKLPPERRREFLLGSA